MKERSPKDRAIDFFMMDDHYGDCMPGRKWHHCWVQVFDIMTSICTRCQGDWFKCPCVPKMVGGVFSYET